MAVQFPVPPTALQRAFSESVEPMRRHMSNLIVGSRRLGAIRDLLLPRLVTGRIDVSDVDLGDLLTADAA